ncbi:hypothetical protein JWS13_34210 [Rhodococcus pseudokoreensis]|uniref:SipW-cognate class signal peptide n=1 Tax=Rhodococcus pseudokoreensis TaxID=2811421 RepID=A0A974W9Y8_9NOCA|nr:TasA family protein [Rhodococcus pseudokoreensis]QSE93290.1 hypothetical protein JWS13_34210 [Rhodococcus pseudokoreensis]
MTHSLPSVSVRVRAVLSLGILLGLGAVGTLAVWSDDATATSGTFTTGTIDIRANAVDSYTFGTLALANMLPGESVAQPLVVNNVGTAALKYTMSATTPAGSPALASQLTVSVYNGGSAGNATGNGMRTGTCSGGALLGQSALAAGGPAPVITAPQTVAGLNGAQNLCFVAALAPTAPVAVQSQSVGSATFTFSATAG